ncbi:MULTISPECIES: PD-(D/E)XK nuclease superfamily protein [unclassified Candidatus Tisiphia]|uniref:PD-(D/E)XK nuclease superfamily protein n=1 Tax=unclassified Candidatus Tisiphia TaxID=2996318 RepID=UPI00312C8E46
MDKIQGGSIANKTGNELEVFINNRLVREGYVFVPKTRFIASQVLAQPIYTRQFNLGETIYNTAWQCDFILYHPIKHSNCLVIESKWQQSGGSADEKYPYTILNVRKQSVYNVIIIIDGDGYKKGALQWLKDQVYGNLKGVFSMSEFTTWANKQNI